MFFYKCSLILRRVFGPRIFKPIYFRTGFKRHGGGRRMRLPRRSGLPRNKIVTLNKKVWIIILLLLMGVSTLLGFLHIEKKLKPTILIIAEARSKQIAIDLISQVVKRKIADNVEYNDLIKVHKDNNKKIVLLQPNTAKINRLQAETAIEVNKALENLQTQKMWIPLGQVTDSYLLATYGPKVPVKLAPIGNIEVKRHDEFESAGINQTRHLLSFEITANVRMFSPLLEDQVQISTEVLIADNIMVGDVPKTHVDLKLDSLNLNKLLEQKP